MDNNNMNNDVNAATPADNKGEQKTFTQDDVNRIVQDRLAKDRAKTSEELGKREQELKDKEFRLNSRQKLIERGYSEELLDALNCSSEEAFNKALDTIDSFLKERVPSAEQQELEKNKARFTVPMNSRQLQGTDPIKEAMRL